MRATSRQPSDLYAARAQASAARNVAAGTLTMLKSSLAGIDTVANPSAAGGGVDGESLAAARQRAAMDIRSRHRAVTAEDYEFLGGEASPRVARSRCVPPTDGGPVLLYLLPRVDPADRRLEAAELKPDESLLSTVAEYLDEQDQVDLAFDADAVGPGQDGFNTRHQVAGYAGDELVQQFLLNIGRVDLALGPDQIQQAQGEVTFTATDIGHLKAFQIAECFKHLVRFLPKVAQALVEIGNQQRVVDIAGGYGLLVFRKIGGRRGWPAELVIHQQQPGGTNQHLSGQLHVRGSNRHERRRRFS